MFMYYHTAVIVSEFFVATIVAVIIYSKHAVFYRTIGYKIITKKILELLADMRKLLPVVTKIDKI
jgi:hypothetical protein